MENALIELAGNFEAVMADGISGKEPFLDASLMREAAKAKAKELASLPQFDLHTEAGRKGLRAAIKPIKQVFSDFEKNIKVVKKMYLEVPKMCDASSKAVRDTAEPAIEKAETPFRELKAQEALTEKWWKKEGIPCNRYGLELAIGETSEAEPLPYSTEAEKADFLKHKAEYLQTLKEALERMELAEKAAEAEREKLRLQAEEQRRVAEEQRREREKLEAERRRVAEEQRREREKLEAERRRVEADKAEIEKQREAVNPAEAGGLNKESLPAGAPSALSEWQAEAMEYEAEAAIAEIVGSEGESAIARDLLEAIKSGEIPHVRFIYE